MLYGYKAYLENKTATVVTAADTIEEYENWFKTISNQSEKPLWTFIHVSKFLEMLRPESPFRGFKHPVYAFYHNDEIQQDAFIAEQKIMLNHEAYGRDRHRDMLNVKKAELGQDTGLFSTSNQDKTIAEINGLTDDNDPYDRRSEEEKEHDKKLKEKLEKLEKEGKLSGQSFGGGKKTNTGATPTTNVGPFPPQTTPQQSLPINKRPSILDQYKDVIDGMLSTDVKTTATSVFNALKTNHGYNGGLTIVKEYVRARKQAMEKAEQEKTAKQPFIEEIRVKQNSDGSFDVDNVLAHKRGGEVDEEAREKAKQEHESKVEEAKAGKRRFSPQDFAAVLKGDGRDDNYGIAAVKPAPEEIDPNTGTRRIALSDEAEAARKEYQEQQRTLAGKQEQKRDDNERLAENKEKHEANNGVFKGVDLVGEEVPIEAFPEDVKDKLIELGHGDSIVLVSHYPHNASLAGKVLLPFESFDTYATVELSATMNLTTLGSVTVAGPGVAVCEKTNNDQPGWAIYTYRETPKEVWVVKIR